MDMLHSATVLMGAAVIVVSISHRFGFGSVLGYIIAGLSIGPWGLNLVSNSESILQFSEIGVVLLLFIIGLEMKPARLWALRRSILGLGITQMMATTLLLAALALVAVNAWVTALIVGFGLSLSSTAFALQLLEERRRLPSPYGRSALHILLFQDLATIPVLAATPIIAVAELGSVASLLKSIASTLLILTIFWLFARFLLRPILRFVAATRIHEILISAALLLVLGSALLMQSIGVSMALGAFLAGVLVADSEYRYQLESDIEPFKGLLLGLFFMAVGMSANLGLLFERAGTVLLIALAIVICKGVVLFVIARLVKLNNRQALLLAVYLSQGGEFGFILFTLSTRHGLMAAELSELLIVAITLSMMMTPVLLYVIERLIKSGAATRPSLDYDVIDAPEPKVVIAGFGRFGQIVSRLIRTQNIYFTAIDIDPGRVDFIRRLGSKIYYGDALQKQLLDTAGTDKAETFVLAIGDIETSLKIAAMVKRGYPHVKLFARAHTRRHEMRLRALGADVIIRDTLLSSMHLAEQVLLSLGMSEKKAAYVKERFYRHDAETLNKQIAYLGDQEMLIKSQREALRELEELFVEDEMSFPEEKPVQNKK